MTVLLSVYQTGPYIQKLFRKQARWQGIIACLASSRTVNAALPEVSVQVEGVQCLALIDTGCSQSIDSVNHFQGWSSLSGEIRIIDSMSWVCCGVGAVSIVTNGGNHAKVNVLVPHEKPLGYDLLIGIDTI